MTTRLLSRLLSLWAVYSASGAVASPVLTFDPSRGGTGLNHDQTVGWEFDVVAPVAVTHLAWFDQDRDGLSTSHRVGLWDSTGRLLADAAVPQGAEAVLDDIWRIVPITQVTLLVGRGYLIGGMNYAASTDRIAGGVLDHVVDPRVAYGGSRYAMPGTGFSAPTHVSAGINGLYGPSFNVVAVPEPACILLGGAALLVVRFC
jgi:hypothetical protein